MGRKEITTKEDLMKVIELFENTGITYWLDGGWGVDILAGKQTRIHRDIDINFDAQHTEKLLNVLLNLGYKIDTDWKPVRYGQYKSGMFKGFMKEVVKFQVLLGILPNYSATKIKLSKNTKRM